MKAKKKGGKGKMKIRIILQKKNTFFKIFQGIETNPSKLPLQSLNPQILHQRSLTIPR